MVKGIKIPNQLNHGGTNHQDVEDGMGTPHVEFARISTFRESSLGGIRATYANEYQSVRLAA